VPLYEYECPQGHKEQVLQLCGAPKERVCNPCLLVKDGSNPEAIMRRIISVPNPAVITKDGTNAQRLRKR
jgi:hypothetical protein